MILKKYIRTTWNSANKNHLISKGYTFTKIGEDISVLMEDLHPNSPIKVIAECDCCGKIFERERRFIKETCFCRSCSLKKYRSNKRKRCKCGNVINRPKDHDYCSDCRITQYTRNDYFYLNNNTAVLILRSSKNIVNGFTIIDSKNLKKVIKYKWRIGTGNYIIGGKDNHTRLHKYIMNCPRDKEIDHINNITIDNRESNLRIVTRKDNCSNRRNYKNFRYADIKFNDVTNGEGVRVSFWLQGCDLHCKDCHNYAIWDFNGGKQYSKDVVDTVVNNIDINNIRRNISVLGGEPLHEKNIDTTLDFLINVKRKKPDVNVWLWTGYEFENLNNDKQKIALLYIDVLIDGRFELDKRDITLKFRGSTNQRIIDVKESLNQDKVILYKQS